MVLLAAKENNRLYVCLVSIQIWSQIWSLKLLLYLQLPIMHPCSHYIFVFRNDTYNTIYFPLKARPSVQRVYPSSLGVPQNALAAFQQYPKIRSRDVLPLSL